MYLLNNNDNKSWWDIVFHVRIPLYLFLQRLSIVQSGNPLPHLNPVSTDV